MLIAAAAAWAVGSHSAAEPPPARPVPELPRAAMAAVDPARCKAVVDRLAAFGTRSTLSDPAAPERGIGAARRWLREQFEAIGATLPDGRRLEVRMESFIQGPTPNGRIAADTEIVNVVAVLPGRDAGRGRCYVVGHYDSRNADGMDSVGDAPGANDDASGVAVVMECARVLASLPPLDGTVVFLCTAGEEQGLLGARYHADQAAARREAIVAVLNNDIVGDPSCPPGVVPTANGSTLVRVFSEGLPRAPSAERLAQVRALSAESDSPSRQVARYVAEVGRAYGAPVRAMLVFRPDRFLRGGDHSAFNEAGFPAVRFTEVDEDYTRQHQNVSVRDGRPYGDVPEYVDAAYLAGVARLNVATLVCLANAPPAPERARIITAELDNRTTIRWDAGPEEAGIAGYEVVWRATTDAEWMHAADVGLVTEAVIDRNKDDWFFGVRAYDAEGYRSVVAFCGEARR
jgi:hypothetical protein